MDKDYIRIEDVEEQRLYVQQNTKSGGLEQRIANRAVSCSRCCYWGFDTGCNCGKNKAGKYFEI